ncbi:AsmA-like C-terminal region-containing protein [Uliginosibacterium sp. H1]|uniref:AsmA-like C-terminal region-containing protein n=1 Tax=Uliginosibacterium sp. H1 TaxID=3114757 RepID=UPI002E16D52E|nr:AsmA-like C-terminal region-containing protein [Uliginosibacterium sp. H1]
MISMKSQASFVWRACAVLATWWLGLSLGAPALAADAPESWLGLPVSYAERSYTFRPWPAIELKSVRIMTSDAITMNRAWVRPDWAQWIQGGNTNAIRVDADEIVARPAALARLGLSDGKSTRRITHMRFERLKLLMGTREVNLPAGEMEFAPDGTLSHIRLSIEGVNFDATPNSGKLALLVQMANWRWDALPALRFENVTAQGDLTDFGLSFHKIGGNADGGSLAGTLRLAVDGNFVMDGELTLASMRAADVLGRLRAGTTVSGALNGVVKLTASGEQFTDLASNLAASGTYVINKGAIDRFGIASGMQRESAGPAGGGNTRFERMNGTFNGKTGQVASVTVQRLDSGPLQGSGNFVVMQDGVLKGGFAASMRLPSGATLSRSFALGGKADAPQLSTRD